MAVVGVAQQLVGRAAQPVERGRVHRAGVDADGQVAVVERAQVGLPDDLTAVPPRAPASSATDALP